MTDWTPESIERARTRLLYDVSPEALERGRREREHLAKLPSGPRCTTGNIGHLGECLFCGAVQGESCRPS